MTLAGRLRSSEIVIATVLAALTAAIAYAAIHKLGTAGLLAPLGLALLVAMMRRPLVMLSFVVGLTVMCEGLDFGLFNFTAKLYTHATVMNVLVALVVLSVGLDLLRHKRRPRSPAPLGLASGLLAFAMLVGLLTAHAAGVGLTSALHSENLLDYLLFMPLAIANIEITPEQANRLLRGAFALAIVKALLGLAEVAGGYAPPIEGTGALTYYEPTANWLILIATLAIFAAVVARARPPLWTLLGSPLIFAALLLSYRRSFWIAGVLGLALVLLLALTPSGRRILVPIVLLLIGSILLLGKTHLEGQSPILQRATSLAPTKIVNNVEDRYRLDERANVIAQIEKHPISGLGIDGEWSAAHRTLPIEHEGGRGYVHFAALWYWLKLGVLGLLAYAALLIATMAMAWRLWRDGEAPILRVFGLASLCGFVGLAVMETTASFTGVDTRFTVLIAAQIGIVALLSRAAGHQSY